ncbi:MAG: DUF211 domain-containing protein [Haloarculaceae archaeon]
MTRIRRLVLDVLKPYEPELPEFARRVADGDSTVALTASLLETDRKVQNVKLSLEGEDLDVDAIEARIERLGASVHSIDEVACGDYVVAERRTPQD